MLHSLAGTLLDCDDDYAVIDTGGVRFQVEVPGSTASQLEGKGKPAVLYTRLSFNANDGTFALFGFSTEAERDCFDVLTSMSGIGPRKALAILSQIEIGAFANAIIGQDLTYLSKLKGVGKKTAERIMVELREKMVPFAGPTTTSTGPVLPVGKENVKDAIEAMIALGTRQAVAEKAVAKAVENLGEDARTEDLIRDALKNR